MSIVDRSARNPHCDSGYIRQLLEAYQYDPNKYFADNAAYVDAPVVVTVVPLALVFVYGYDLGVQCSAQVFKRAGCHLKRAL